MMDTGAGCGDWDGTRTIPRRQGGGCLIVVDNGNGVSWTRKLKRFMMIVIVMLVDVQRSGLYVTLGASSESQAMIFVTSEWLHRSLVPFGMVEVVEPRMDVEHVQFPLAPEPPPSPAIRAPGYVYRANL
jgi:hypothetical protein